MPALRSYTGTAFQYQTNVPSISIEATQYIWSHAGFFAASDQRIKTPISGAFDDLSIINALTVRRFRHKDSVRFPGEDGEGLERIGFFVFYL